MPDEKLVPEPAEGSKGIISFLSVSFGFDKLSHLIHSLLALSLSKGRRIEKQQ
ncbi:MAG: hypothetical protein AAGA27_00225 [Pseudomonadota bacterium]